MQLILRSTNKSWNKLTKLGIISNSGDAGISYISLLSTYEKRSTVHLFFFGGGIGKKRIAS